MQILNLTNSSNSYFVDKKDAEYETCLVAVSHYECVRNNKTLNYNQRPKAADGESSEGIRSEILSDEQGRRPKRR